MAKRRSFFEKVSQRIHRDFGKLWTSTTVDTFLRTVARFSRQDGIQASPLVGEGLIRTIQQEAELRISEEEYFYNRDLDPPEPALYPGLMVAWEKVPCTVDVDRDVAKGTWDEPSDTLLDEVSVDQVRSLFPACLLIDVRNYHLNLYDIDLDALFVYPSHDQDRGYDLLVVIGLGLRHGLFEPLLSKIVLTGSTLADALERTEDEIDRLMARVLSEVDSGNHDTIFSPLEDEPIVRDVAIRTLALMFAKEAVCERHERRLTCHYHIKARPRASVRPVADRAAKAPAPVRPGKPAAVVEEQEPAAPAEATPVEETPVEKAPEQRPAAETAPAEVAPAVAPDTDQGPQASPEPAVEDGASALDEQAEGAVSSEPVPEADAGETAPDEATFRRQAEEPAPGHVSSKVEDELLEEVCRLEDELTAERAKVGSLQYHLRQARESLDEARGASAAQAKRAKVLETMEIPTTPAEALALAEHAFPDRICVLEEARRSAREFVRGSTREVWAVLRSIAVTLHPMIFGSGHANVVYAFQNECGFELALREMKLAKGTRDFARLRRVMYKGQEHYASSHVKGRGRADGETLRVHFFADYQDRLLVISHCGEHLTTYDSASR